MTASLSVHAAGEAGYRLSGLVVGQLGPGEQFALWALRCRRVDGGLPSAAFLKGFRLAFGLALLEAALAAFEELFTRLHRHERGLGLFPLRCACVSQDERALIGLLASAQAGEGPWLGAAVRQLSPTAGVGESACAFAAMLRRAGLALPPLDGQVPRTAALH